jgi:magnesium-transporting ATPase (P-type)
VEEQALHWATLTAEGVLGQLETDRRGLSAEEAHRRLRRFGPNELPRARRRSWLVEFGGNFVHLFALLLWVAAGLAWLVAVPELAAAIVVVILVNGTFSHWQEYQAGRAVEALERLLPRQVMVRRGGVVEMAAAEEVVPGDVLVLCEGELVPADARVLAAERLRIDVSALTGESRLVTSIAQAVPAMTGPTGTLPNLVFAGSVVASGRGEAAVFATGGDTEFGRLARLTRAEERLPSPLEREVRWITRVVALLSAGLGGAFFAIGRLLGGLDASQAFVFALGVLVANVPEGLLPTLTLSLALAVRRMAGRRALVKRLSAVEALGATTVILTDKTGTLTENEMTVREAWTARGGWRFGGVGYDPSGRITPEPEDRHDWVSLLELLRIGALCCDARLVARDGHRAKWGIVGDPTEGAILVAAAKAGLSQETLGALPRITELPFDSSRKRMTTVQRVEDGVMACVKGAPSEVIPRCESLFAGDVTLPFDESLRQAASAAHDELTGRGLRVLAVARRRLDAQPGPAVPPDEIERSLTFLGLLAMEDPPRAEVPGAVASCRQAGIRVVMVTGDDARTAVAIAREIGLVAEQATVVTGVELAAWDEPTLEERLDSPGLLFARVAPEQKLRLVEAFRRRGAVVAVTGDGVNDAPALRRADVGVAMGETGTDVAREAADVVLADDNFASIVSAIEEGRAVYDNIRKFVTYILASNVPELAPFVVFVLTRIPLPLTVMQILAVDLGTDLFPALALGLEAPEPDVMQRPPRARTQRLLTPAMLLRAYAWLGLLEAVLGFGGYLAAFWFAGWRPGEPLAGAGPLYATATTMSLAGIVAAQVGNAFACRSERQSIRALGITSNRGLLAGIGAELLVLLLLVYLPPAARIFSLHPLGLRHWALLALFPVTLLAAEEIRKALARRAQSAARR